MDHRQNRRAQQTRDQIRADAIVEVIMRALTPNPQFP